MLLQNKTQRKATLFNGHESFHVTPPRHDEPQGHEGDLKRRETN
jgi:hypothetical protein